MKSQAMTQAIKKIVNTATQATAITLLMSCLLTHSAQAQSAHGISKKSTEPATWYEAPRQFQIIDDSPVVRDFREAPQNPGSIDLPGAPGGTSGGHGAGALGALSGGSPSIPAGGLHLPGNGPGYRTGQSSMPGLGTLPKSGFGGSNIPARGLGPRGLLPSGNTQNVIGKLMSEPRPLPAVAPAAKAMVAHPTVAVARPAGPTVASYGGGYDSGAGSDYGASTNRTKTFVRGSLLRK